MMSPCLIVSLFSVYFLCGNSMSLSNGFAWLQVLYAIDAPIRWIPQFVGVLMEFAVSMKRIQKFLQWDEINQEIVDRDSRELKNSEIAVCLDNWNFYWGGRIKESHQSEKLQNSKIQKKINENEVDGRNFVFW